MFEFSVLAVTWNADQRAIFKKPYTEHTVELGQKRFIIGSLETHSGSDASYSAAAGWSVGRKTELHTTMDEISRSIAVVNPDSWFKRHSEIGKDD